MYKKYTALAFLSWCFLVPFSIADAELRYDRDFDESSAEWAEIVEHTLREEKEGAEIWYRFQAGEIDCEQLTDVQFELLGEYFMRQITGVRHSEVNVMLTRQYGKEGEELEHTILGKQYSGCDTSLTTKGAYSGWATENGQTTNSWGPIGSMMNGWRNFSSDDSYSEFMNSRGEGPTWTWILFDIIWWTLAIIGLVTIIKWIISKRPSKKKSTRNN